MTTVFSVALVLIILTFVGWPFYRLGEAAKDIDTGNSSPLETRKKAAYAAIKEAEFDLRMGKLSEEDFAALKSKHRNLALSAIAGMAESHGKLEQASAGNTEQSSATFAFCPTCGHAIPPQTRFCGSCGTSVLRHAG